MFRNVTGVEEAVSHAKHSQESLIDDHHRHSIPIVQDIQSEEMLKHYSTLKVHWCHEREHLIETLKYLQEHHRRPEEIESVKNLIECLNILINHGDLSTQCQHLIEQMKKRIHPIPEMVHLPRKPLGNQLIRLPRHASTTTTTTVKKYPSELIHLDRDTMQSGIQFYVVAEPFRSSLKFEENQQEKISP